MNKLTELELSSYKDVTEIFGTGKVNTILEEYVNTHGYFLNKNLEKEVDITDVLFSWYENFFKEQKMRAMEETKILNALDLNKDIIYFLIGEKVGMKPDNGDITQYKKACWELIYNNSHKWHKRFYAAFRILLHI